MTDKEIIFCKYLIHNKILSQKFIRIVPDELFWLIGNVDFEGRKHIPELPNNFEVGGNLDLSNTNVTELPKNMWVRGNLILNNTKIRLITPCLVVRGYLLLDGVTLLEPFSYEKIGKSIQGNFNIAQNSIRFILE